MEDVPVLLCWSNLGVRPWVTLEHWWRFPAWPQPLGMQWWSKWEMCRWPDAGADPMCRSVSVLSLLGAWCPCPCHPSSAVGLALGHHSLGVGYSFCPSLTCWRSLQCWQNQLTTTPWASGAALVPPCSGHELLRQPQGFRQGQPEPALGSGCHQRRLSWLLLLAGTGLTM